jgi:hypothetical protein
MNIASINSPRGPRRPLTAMTIVSTSARLNLLMALAGFCLSAAAQVLPPPTNLRIDGVAVADPAPAPSGSYGWTLTETNVGLAPLGLRCASLPAYTGGSQIPAGARISGVRFTQQADLSNGNIIIERSCFQPTSGVQNAVATTTRFSACNSSCPVIAQQKVIIRDSEFDGSLLPVSTAAYMSGFWGVADLQRNYIHHFGSGIALYNVGDQLSALVENNYVHRMLSHGDPATTGNHSDAFTIRDFPTSANPNRTAVIRNNRFNTDTSSATGSFFMQDTWNSGLSNVTATGNLLEGNGYEMAGEKRNAPTNNNRAINNRFRGSSDGGYGACYTSGGFVWAEWRDNYFYHPTNANNAGAAVGC